MSRKWPMWLVPIWISKPSSVRVGGTAMTPAFKIKVSSRSHSEVNVEAAARMDLSEARSRGRYLISTLFVRLECMYDSASFAFCSLRAARYIRDGLCFARPRIISFPRPPFPVS